MAKNINRKVTIYINGKEVENNIESIRKEVRKLRAEQAKCTIGSEEYIEMTKAIKQLDKVIAKHNEELGRTESRLDCLVRKIGDIGNVLTGFQSFIDLFNGGIDSFKNLAADAAELDDTYADVMKTTGLAKDSVEKLNEAVISVLKGFQDKSSYDELVLHFKDPGLDGARATQAISSLTNSIEEINTAQAITNKEIASGTSVVREFEVKNNSLILCKFRRVFYMCIELGQQLYLIIINMTKSSTTGIRLLNATITAVKENKTSFGLLAG